jgi:hypothetical protein
VPGELPGQCLLFRHEQPTAARPRARAPVHGIRRQPRLAAQAGLRGLVVAGGRDLLDDPHEPRAPLGAQIRLRVEMLGERTGVERQAYTELKTVLLPFTEEMM